MAPVPSVREIMTQGVLTCTEGWSVREALNLAVTNGVGSIVVVEEGDQRKPKDILTKTDFLFAIYHGLEESRVGELLKLLKKKPLLVVREDQSILDLMRLLEENGIKHVPVVSEGGELVGIVSAGDLLRRSNYLLLVDPLTGLENRRSLELLALKLSSGRVKDVWILFVDVDHFKEINDSLGHLVGDEVLRRLSDVLRRSVRVYDQVFRYGGEEFVVILYRATQEEALRIAERIRRRVEGGEWPKGIRVTVSVGVAPLRDSLYKGVMDADTAMYRAKRMGRNRVELFTGVP